MYLKNVVDVSVERFAENPLITPESDDRIGSNINGPSVIRASDWFDDPLDTYYLYFAHHHGEFIRLATANDLHGPWEVYSPGTLHLNETRFDEHIASPCARIDPDTEQIYLYFHGCCGSYSHSAGQFDQVTDVATSTDGINFTVQGETLGNSYFRVWEYDDTYYAVANDGHLYRSDDPLSPFERLHELFPENRHFAVRFYAETVLQVFLTRRGDRPERIQVTGIDLGAPVEEWRADPHPPETVLWPEREYEGGTRSISASERGAASEPTRALRDPAVYEEDGRAFLFYAIEGERGIAGAELY